VLITAGRRWPFAVVAAVNERRAASGVRPARGLSGAPSCAIYVAAGATADRTHGDHTPAWRATETDTTLQRREPLRRREGKALIGLPRSTRTRTPLSRPLRRRAATRPRRRRPSSQLRIPRAAGRPSLRVRGS
jgi:hypothetical protein